MDLMWIAILIPLIFGSWLSARLMITTAFVVSNNRQEFFQLMISDTWTSLVLLLCIWLLGWHHWIIGMFFVARTCWLLGVDWAVLDLHWDRIKKEFDSL